MLSAILEQIAAELGVKLSWKGLSFLRVFLQRLPGWGKTQYLAELRAAIAEMPFIYRDLPLDVLGNFVDTDLKLSLDGFYTSPLPDPDSRPLRARPLETLRNYRRFVLVGDAGMGKTTLFRFAALSLIAHGDQSPILYPAEPKLLPLYVPLKALDAYSQFPILNYLQQNHAYFRGKIGLARLVRLARKSRLLLLLDGYDEIPIAAGTHAIKAEIRLYFCRSMTDAERTLGSQHPFVQFYRNFVGNRVGLSSRREFLLANLLDLAEDTSYLFASGVSDARVRLVNNIFQRYRATGGQFFRDQLNEETFMRDLAVAGSEGLQRVSKNPLFLTVMCYVYVNAVREGTGAANMWRSGELALIDKCIDLLLNDIDEYKARGLSASERTALMNRRAAYSSEKKELLRFLAAEAFFDNKGVLSYAYLEQKTEEYFRAHPGPNTDDILKGLASDDATANLLLQIIFCGVIVLTQSGTKGRAFDFPHRRFREVLAADHLNSDAGVARLGSAIENAALSEFVSVYAERTGRILPIVDAIRSAIAGTGDGYALGKLLKTILRQIANIKQRSKLVETLLDKVAQDSLGKRLPRTLLNFLDPSPSLIEKFQSLLATAIQTNNASLLNFAKVALDAVENPSTQRAHDLMQPARRRSGMLAGLFAGANPGQERLQQFLQERFPDPDIKSLTPEWAAALLKLWNSKNIDPSIRITLVEYFDLHDKEETGRMTTVEEILLRLSGSGAHKLKTQRARINETTFVWVMDD